MVAIKCVLLNTLSENSQNNLVNEIEILKKLKHKFIVQLLDFQWDKKFVYIILEYCGGGQLATIIQLKRTFPEYIVQHFLQQLASALKFLRENNISHMDLKPQNILITGIAFVNLLNELNTFKVWRNVILKVADFGFAQHLKNDEMCNSVRGSPRYMAPEILLGQQYNASVDLWSIGVIIYECLFNSAPYNCQSTQQLVESFSKNAVKISIPKNNSLSNDCCDLLQRLLEKDTRKRISFENFFNHPFIDLEHMPSIESYEIGLKLVNEAISDDNEKLFKSAFYKYRDALMYLMPFYKWGDPTKPVNFSKQESLRSTIVKYIDRAEQLQKMCNLIQLNSSQMKQIETVYNLIDSARDYHQNGALSDSLETYEKALEMALKMIKTSDQIQEEFFSDINNWFTEAEQIKTKLQNTDDNKQLENIKSTESNNDDSSNLKWNSRNNKRDTYRKFPLEQQDTSEPNCFMQ